MAHRRAFRDAPPVSHLVVWRVGEFVGENVEHLRTADNAATFLHWNLAPRVSPLVVEQLAEALGHCAELGRFESIGLAAVGEEGTEERGVEEEVFHLADWQEASPTAAGVV
ncbi:MAG: hypothetical protein ABIP53_06585, partial [Candidatus Limnocylindrales bacterium]